MALGNPNPQALGAALAAPMTWNPAATPNAPLEPMTPTGLSGYNAVPVSALGNIAFAQDSPMNILNHSMQNSGSPWVKGGGTVTYQGQTIPSSISYLASTGGGGVAGDTSGTQSTVFNFDPSTGAYVPASQQGHSGGTGLVDNLIKAGAILGGGAALGGSLAGLGNQTSLAPAFDAAPTLDASVFSAGAPEVGTAGSAAGGMTFDNAGLVQGISDSAAASSAPQLAGDLTNIAGQGASGLAADIGGGGLTSSQLNLAKNLLNLGKTALQGTPVGQPRVNSAGVGASSALGAGIGGLSDNLKMMLEANAQAQMNGQPLPFPGMGGMGTPSGR
jgi:hypothetical protein